MFLTTVFASSRPKSASARPGFYTQLKEKIIRNQINDF